MLTEKYKTAKTITISAAEYFYKYGTAIVVTDGEYLQLENEEVKKEC